MAEENTSTTEVTEVTTETTTSTWWKSKVFWVAVVGFGSAVAAVFGYAVDADTQTAIVNVITSIVSAF